MEASFLDRWKVGEGWGGDELHTYPTPSQHLCAILVPFGARLEMLTGLNGNGNHPNLVRQSQKAVQLLYVPGSQNGIIRL